MVMSDLGRVLLSSAAIHLFIVATAEGSAASIATT